MPDASPERIKRAVEILDADPADAVLEIGCGPGTAVSLLCQRLTSGRVVALDRSAVAVERATRRNAEHVAAGKVLIHQSELKDFDGDGRRFDVIFAINVNVFWAGSASAEIAAVQSLLAPNGEFFLFYEQPPGADPAGILSTVTARLTDAGFVVDAGVEQMVRIRAVDRRVGRCSATSRA